MKATFNHHNPGLALLNSVEISRLKVADRAEHVQRPESRGLGAHQNSDDQKMQWIGT